MHDFKAVILANNDVLWLLNLAFQYCSCSKSVYLFVESLEKYAALLTSPSFNFQKIMKNFDNELTSSFCKPSQVANLLNYNVPMQVKASVAVLSAQLCFSGWHIVASVAYKGGANESTLECGFVPNALSVIY